MTELLLEPSSAAPRPTHDIVRDALIESRQRWRHLVSLAADLAFETDAAGRFVLVMPGTVLGWPAAALVGQPSDLLVGDDDVGTLFNPFRPVIEIRRQHARVRCADGTLAMMTISATPLHDAAGLIIGARGIGVDVTHCDAQTLQLTGQLRRGDVLGHLIACVGQERDADSMMDAALRALIHALGAEGAAVIGAMSDGADIEVLHEAGSGAADVLEAAAGLLAYRTREPGQTINLDGRLVLAAGCQTRSGAYAGLTLWRSPGSVAWDPEDSALAGAAVGVVRMILEQEAVRREMAHQARIDPLTGLLNRRTFIDAMRAEFVRMDRQMGTGTLMCVSLDSFKAVNDRLGHAVGDQLLVHLADMLRKLIRPYDLVTRMAGDEFAVWLNGADHMTAAERADCLCKAAPGELQALLPEAFANLGVSIGIATRSVNSHDSIEDLTRRADMAMYDVKRSGRRHWRVSLQDDD